MAPALQSDIYAIVVISSVSTMMKGLGGEGGVVVVGEVEGELGGVLKNACSLIHWISSENTRILL
jgi:hypothetical protein